MKHLIKNDGFVLAVFIVIAWIATAIQGHTQTVTSGSQAQAGSSASANVNTGSYSGAQIINNGADTLTYGGSYRVENVPSVSAPGVVTAHNCALGMSAGIAGVGGGLSIGGTRIDENCEIISQAAALNSLVGAKAAIHHMAQIPEVCRTLRSTGKIAANSVCPGDPKAKRTASSKSVTAPKSASVTRPELRRYPWQTCEKRDGKVFIKWRSGMKSEANKQACLRSLGYGG